MPIPVLVGILLGSAAAAWVNNREIQLKRRLVAARMPSWLRNQPLEKRQQDILEIQGDKNNPLSNVPLLGPAIAGVQPSIAPFAVVPDPGFSAASLAQYGVPFQYGTGPTPVPQGGPPTFNLGTAPLPPPR
jgi:hypothetical protein